MFHDSFLSLYFFLIPSSSLPSSFFVPHTLPPLVASVIHLSFIPFLLVFSRCLPFLQSSVLLYFNSLLLFLTTQISFSFYFPSRLISFLLFSILPSLFFFHVAQSILPFQNHFIIIKGNQTFYSSHLFPFILLSITFPFFPLSIHTKRSSLPFPFLSPFRPSLLSHITISPQSAFLHLPCSPHLAGTSSGAGW